MNYILTPIEDFIKTLYHHLSIIVPEQFDMIEIGKKLNIGLFINDVKSKVMERNGTYYLFIDSRLTSEHQWQDFGHELCHALRHAGNQLTMPETFLDFQEIQANNFMYHFCVPTFMLLKYEIVNYYNIKDGIPFVSRTFNVTEDFAEKRLIQFRNQIQQAKSDEEHRKYMESLYPIAPPYSKETNDVLKQLNMILEKKGVYR